MCGYRVVREHLTYSEKRRLEEGDWRVRIVKYENLTLDSNITDTQQHLETACSNRPGSASCSLRLEFSCF